jgi:hypothetical protein
MKYVIWAGWRASLPVAKIRVKWNREFPTFSAGNGAAGSAHIRTGLGRGNFILQNLKTK